MSETCWNDPAWYGATSLTERLASRRGVPRPEPGRAAPSAALRLKRWRSQAPFADGPYFSLRLAADGLTEGEFLDLLGEPDEAIRRRFAAPPPWLTELAGAFSAAAHAPLETSSLPEPLRNHEVLGLLTAVEPLLRQARERFREGAAALARAHPRPPFDPDRVLHVLFAPLPARLLSMLSRTLVLELHVARLQGLLEGDTPAARFRSFVERLRRPEHALACFREYPVLARQVAERVADWVATSLELLGHLCADWEALRATFSPTTDPGVLVGVDGGVGDAHRGGRAVLIARFASGLALVYKPKSLAVDVHFQELLAWLNERGAHPPFRTLTVLDRCTHGWVEFVAAAGCGSAEEVRRFYERQGGYLALLYALEATDFHFENLIAAGEYPVLIDLEALFHARFGLPQAAGATELAANLMGASMLRVGLLPQRLGGGADAEGIDLSGLGAAPGQLSPAAVPYWEAAGTDEMRLARTRRPLPGGQNRPTLDGREVEALGSTEAIVSGFIAVYRLLLEHREALLADDGPLARFASDEVRVILRPTQTYARLLHESFHPDLLRSALDRDRFFDRLWTDAVQRPALARVIPAERADLERGDVPLFNTRPTSRDLWGSAGACLPDVVDAPGMDLVRRRLRGLGEPDLEQQLWFLRASLATLSMGTEQERWSSYRLTEPEEGAGADRLLAAARAVGERLEALALRGADDATWIGLTYAGKRGWLLLPLGATLYGGLPGVALFLAHLGAATNEERYTVLARAALTAVCRHRDGAGRSLEGVGGFEGWGGLIYSLTHLGSLWDEPALLREAEAVVERLPDLIGCDEHLDVMAGAAGCLGGLLALYRRAPSERTLAAAVQCGDHLLARARPAGEGIGWVTPIDSVEPLTGFSHGAAGMAWALLELAALTGAERLREGARAAIAYERGQFSPEAGNWRDLRRVAVSRPGIVLPTAWCHGAVGIGLARLRSLPHLRDPATRAEIDVALRTTLAHGFGSNHSLCHGDLGNLELLLQAAERLAEPQWLGRARRLAAGVLEGIEREGWLCGIPTRVESPGLMTGLAGIGYGLLRLANPARVPSVLVLEPPRQPAA
jgi:type 2 lantibiotic biosynthesis protein LanM